MKKTLIVLFIFGILHTTLYSQGLIVDHNSTNITDIPESNIILAKNSLHIAYGHTSHGSQLITGMNDLDAFMGGNDLYVWHEGPLAGYLDIDDYFVSGDLGYSDWDEKTRTYLDNANNSDVNVVIWSWCGQVSGYTEAQIDTYLSDMTSLENDYPNIQFVYMTGHLDGTGLTGNLHLRNEQIRAYCRENNKILYDFEDIESYNPDNVYFGDKIPNDNCEYDSDNNGTRDSNWAIEWQNSHTEGVDWYSCYAAHSQSLNGNQKAYAAWWLWASLAGWNISTAIDDPTELPNNFELSQNYPNPFNPTTTIQYNLPVAGKVNLIVYNILGEKVESLVNENQPAGSHQITFNSDKLSSGIYFYKLEIEETNSKNAIPKSLMKKMILLK